MHWQIQSLHKSWKIYSILLLCAYTAFNTDMLCTYNHVYDHSFSIGSCILCAVDLLSTLWKEGGGDKPVIRKWILPVSPEFHQKFDEIQQQLEELCGLDDFLTGVCSKSKGHILRIAAIFHQLFCIRLNERNDTPSKELSSDAIKAAIDFVTLCGEQAALMVGRKGASTPLSRKLF